MGLGSWVFDSVASTMCIASVDDQCTGVIALFFLQHNLLAFDFSRRWHCLVRQRVGSPGSLLFTTIGRFLSYANLGGRGRKTVTQKSNHQRCLGGFFSFCQFFIVLHKIRHECIMTLHERFTKTTKKTKHGNVYNDRSTLKNAKNGNQKHGFLTIF